MIDDLQKMGLLDQMLTVVKGTEDKEAEDLDEGERIAIALFAGCEMVYGQDEDDPEIITVTTALPIGIVKVDGKFRVYQGPKESIH